MKKTAILFALALLFLVAVPAQALDLTYDVSIEDMSNKFWADEQVYNYTTREWMPPEYYQEFWNGTGLDVPPIANQTGSFNFSITTNIPVNMWVAIQRNEWPGDGGYIGPDPIDDGEWLATSGNVLYATGPYPENQSTTLTGLINSSWWVDSGWYRFWVHGHTYNETLDEPDSRYSSIHFFYLNKTLDVIVMEEPAEEVQFVPMPLAEAAKILIAIIKQVFGGFLNIF